MRKRKEYPPWVEEYRRPGCEIKEIKGAYYLYTYKTVYDKERKKPQKISTGYVGRITEDKGLIPKKSTAPKIGPSMEFGAARLLDLLGEDIPGALQVYFRDEMASTIYVYGKMGLMSPSSLQLIYTHSWDYVQYPGLDFSEPAMDRLLQELDFNREGQAAFMREFATGTRHILLDDPGEDLLYCFSLEPEMAPVYFSPVRGDPVTAVKNAIRECGCKNVILTAGPDFISDAGWRRLQTSLDMEPEKICDIYRKRNFLLAGIYEAKELFAGLQGSTFYNGRLFLNHISLMLYWRILNRILEVELEDPYTVADVVEIMRLIRIQKVDGKWFHYLGLEFPMEELQMMFPGEMEELFNF